MIPDAYLYGDAHERPSPASYPLALAFNLYAAGYRPANPTSTSYPFVPIPERTDDR